MSSLSISASAAAALQQVSFNVHRRKSGGATPSGSGSSIGALPVGAGQNLLSSAIQSLKQTVSAAAAPGTAAAVGATGAPGASGAASTALADPTAASSAPAPVTQDLQGFLHALFAALKQDGLGSASSGSAATATAGGSATAAAAGASATSATSATSAVAAGTGAATAAGSIGQYQGSLVSSLQTLIQQLGGTQAGAQAGTGATAQLTSSFSKLTAAAGGTGTPATSTAQLKNFLSDFLQNVQSGGGGQLQGLVGSHVNANA